MLLLISTRPGAPLLALQGMSKRSLENESIDLWKTMRYGATAAVAVGTGVYAVTTALKKQGVLANLVDEVKTAMQTPSQLVQAPDAPPKMSDGFAKFPAHSPEDEETRAILNMQMEFAMKRNEVKRVQEVSRQLDLLDSRVSNNQSALVSSATLPGLTFATVTPPQSEYLHARTQTRVLPAGATVGYLDADLAPWSEVRATSSNTLGAPPEAGISQPRALAPSLGRVGAVTSTEGYANEVMYAPKEMGTSKNMMACAEDAPVAKPVPRHETKQTALPSPRQFALLQLQHGNVVEALDPVTGKWTPATVHALSKNGLVAVKWDDPGHDVDGRPFHPIGEVWAEQIRVKRHRLPPASAPPQVRALEEAIKPPYGLQIGDTCFAMGTVVEMKWFEAKLIGVRERSPPLRVEYVATLDGQTNELLLPSVRKDYVSIDQIRREKPEEPAETPRERRIVKCEHNSGEATQDESQQTQVADGEREVDDVVIAPDLMCSICERPDDEDKMLVWCVLHSR